MKALVTGGGGFVGANLVRRLAGAGHETHAVLRPGGSAWRLQGLEQTVHLHHVDLASTGAVADLASAARPDWVFHCAAHGAYPHQGSAPAMVRDNLLATVNVVDCFLARGASAVIHTGSSVEYGRKAHAPVEDEVIDPATPYAVTKAAATQYGRSVSLATGARVVTLRLYSIFGPWEEPTRLWPRLVTLGLQGALPPLATPELAHDFTSVEDVVDAALAAATGEGVPRGAIYNIGSGVQTTLAELVAAARAVLPITEEPAWGSHPGRSWDSPCWQADPGRAARELGWRARASITDGMASMARWLQAHPQLLERYRQAAGHPPVNRR